MKLKKYTEFIKVNESYKKDGHRYEIEEVGHTSGTDRGGIEMDKAFAGKDGMLGENGVYISWSDVKRLMKNTHNETKELYRIYK